MHHSILADHAQHDLELIAGHAAGDLTHSARLRADTLLQSCDSCADLRRDLVALASATRTLSRAAHAARDFRIDAAQADRLRRRGWLRSLLRPFGAPRSAARPMAMAFTSLGLAGLLIANLGSAFLGGAASAPLPADQSELAARAGAAASAAPAVVPVAGQPRTSGDLDYRAIGQPSLAPDGNWTKAGDTSSAPPVAVGGGSGAGTDQNRTRDLLEAHAPANLFIVGSLAVLALGLALFGLRIVARRLR